MANTYYDSELTAEEIEQALEAIDGVIVPANNGKVLAVDNGKIVARSVQRSGGGGDVSSVNNILPDLNGNVTVTADDIQTDNNTSVQDEIDSAKNTLNALENGVVLTNSGDKAQAQIPAGALVYIKNNANISEGLYKNTSGNAVGQGTTLSQSDFTGQSDALNAINNKLESPFYSETVTNQTSNESNVALGVGNNYHVVLVICSQGYVCLPFKNSSNAWRAKILNDSTGQQIGSGVSVTTTTYYY